MMFQLEHQRSDFVQIKIILFQEEIIIPHDKCGIVIGKAGNTLRNLRSQFGCSVNLDSTVNTGDPKPLRIAGPPEKVFSKII